MEIYIVMQNVKVNDCFGWHDNGTRPLSAHRSFDVAFDTIFKKYCSIRKKENVSDVDYKDGDEASLEYTFTDPMFGVQYKFEQWISSVELKDEEVPQNGRLCRRWLSASALQNHILRRQQWQNPAQGGSPCIRQL